MKTMFSKSLDMSLFLGLISLAVIQAALEPTQFQQDLASNFTNLLEQIYSENKFETLMLLPYNKKYCFDQDFEHNIKWSNVLLNENEIIYLRHSYNSDILLLLCLPVFDAQTNIQEIVHILASDLQHMRTSRVLVFVNVEIEANGTQLIEFFKACEKNKLLNVVILDESSFETGNFYSYTQFPLFDLQYRALTDSTEIFPDLLQNLQGKTLLTLPDNIEPRCVMYNDKQGQQQIGGYVGKLLNTFANKHHCVFKFPFPVRNDQFILYLDVHEFARNDTIDIGASISPPHRDMNMHDHSCILEIGNLLTLWPVENEIPTYELLVSVFRVELWGMIFFVGILMSILLIKVRKRDARLNSNLLDFFLNDISLRGVLGQSFNMPTESSFSFKLVCIIICIAGLVNTTMYSSHLVELLADPPTESPVKSFDDVPYGKIAIINKNDVIERRGEVFWEKYKSIFKFITFLERLDILRGMDNKYGHMYISPMWPLIQEQQRCFARKIFRLSKELYYYEHFLLAIPVNENSIYKEPLNRLILQLKDTGIFNQWTSMSFYEMVSLKRMSLKDLSDARVHGALSVLDFYWIWMMYIFLICLSCIAFVVEQIVNRRMKRSEEANTICI